MLFVGVGCCAISVSIVQQDLFSLVVLYILRHLKSIEGIFQPTKGKMPMFTILWGVELLFLVHWKFVYSVILNRLILIYDILNFPLTLLWTHFRNKAIIRIFRLVPTYHFAFWFDQGPICTIHFVVEAASVAEVVAVSIPPP